MFDEPSQFTSTGTVNAGCHNPRQNTAYRCLAVAILGLDVATLADELRSARRSASGHIASAWMATRGMELVTATAAQVTST